MNLWPGRDEDPVLEEPEDDDYDSNWYRKTNRECDGCGDPLCYADEIFILEVSEATMENGQFFMDVLHDDEGNYLYRPYVMHLECWEEAVEMIEEIVADNPPMECDNGLLLCHCCQSTIAHFEPFVSSQFGEIHVSQRSPSGMATETLERIGHMKPVCIACIVHVVDDHFDEWEELVEMLPEYDRPTGENDE